MVLLIIAAVIVGLAWGLGSWALHSMIRHPLFIIVVTAGAVVWVKWGWGASLALGVAYLVLVGLLAFDKLQHGTTEDTGLGLWLLLGFCRSIAWGTRHPLVMSAVAGTLGGLYVAGPVGAAGFWAWQPPVAVAWQMLWPASWETQIASRARASWRTLRVYWPRWNDTMDAAELGQHLHSDGTGVYRIPRRLAVRSTKYVDTVTATKLAAQPTETWQDASQSLAESFGAEACQVAHTNPERHTVELRFRRGDPLADVINPLPPIPVGELDLSAVPIGVTEWGDPWHVRLLDAHLLVAGVMGSGKGSVIGSLMNALAPAIAAGLVEVWAVDPKGGVELALYAPMFTRLAWEPDDMVSLLEEADDDMHARLAGLRGKARRYSLSHDQPHKLIVVDEMGWLTSYAGDKKLRERAELVLGRLLSQGRAPGYTVVGLVQDPRKDNVPMRDLFTTRLALALPEAAVIDAVLGDGAYKRGALCDRIPEDTPGVGYIQHGRAEPLRVRATWTDDPYLQDLADRYPAPRRTVDVTATVAEPASAVAFDPDDIDDLDAWGEAA